MSASSQIRVFVVDDSVVIRRLIARAIDLEPSMMSAGFASDGELALARLEQARPDVVILDIEMPRMNGLEALEQIRQRYPKLPVVMFSRVNDEQSARTVDALSFGVTEFVLKPSADDVRDQGQDYVTSELLPVVRALAAGTVPWQELSAAAAAPGRARAAVSLPPRIPVPVTAVAIGISTGGPTALMSLFRDLQDPLPVPVFVVQHMPPGFTEILAHRIDTITRAEVAEARDGDLVTAGKVYIAPGGRHMTVDRAGSAAQIAIGDGPKINFCRPSVDLLFDSVATTYGPGALGVILTGMGEDGKSGSADIVASGGAVIAQDAATSVVASMPNAVAHLADAVLALDRLGAEIRRRAAGTRP